jgi:hypothetical protein
MGKSSLREEEAALSLSRPPLDEISVDTDLSPLAAYNAPAESLFSSRRFPDQKIMGCLKGRVWRRCGPCPAS